MDCGRPEEVHQIWSRITSLGNEEERSLLRSIIVYGGNVRMIIQESDLRDALIDH